VIYLGLCEESGIMARPWADAGYRCICVDLFTQPGVRDGIEYVQADLLRYLPPRDPIAFVAAFPPCTDQSVSGARWFKEKGIHGLAGAIELVEASVRICEWSGAPWLLENPVSVISSYWRNPDYIFHPYEYGDPYLKKTCLWTGGGFVMPPKAPVEPTEGQKIWRMPPSEDRGRLRSKTPAGFAKAVFAANGQTDARARVCS
jgi:hypothetical protein